MCYIASYLPPNECGRVASCLMFQVTYVIICAKMLIKLVCNENFKNRVSVIYCEV